MKEGLSGSIVNELEVNERWEEQRKEAIALLVKLKTLEKVKPKKMIRESQNTIASVGFIELMIRRTKRNNGR